jgi:hypothetical protein
MQILREKYSQKEKHKKKKRIKTNIQIMRTRKNQIIFVR